MKTAVKTNAKAFAKAAVKSYLKSQVKDPKNIVSNVWSVAAIAGKKGTSLAATNASAREMGTLKTEGQFDYTLLLSLDPTGFASMIYSFAKYGSCSVEDLASSAPEIDFGPGPVGASDVRTIEVSVQNPTTITEITSSPFQGCSIVPSSDCAGKTLKPGDKCTITVKTSGPGKIVGEVHIFTTAYDTIPFAIGVKANSAATSDCSFLADADDAVNLSSIAGVWAWNDDQSQKFVIKSDGTLTFNGNAGQINLIDPLQRTFFLRVGSENRSYLTLNPEHDRFTFSGGTQNRERPPAAVGLPLQAGRRVLRGPLLRRAGRLRDHGARLRRQAVRVGMAGRRRSVLSAVDRRQGRLPGGPRWGSPDEAPDAGDELPDLLERGRKRQDVPGQLQTHGGLHVRSAADREGREVAHRKGPGNLGERSGWGERVARSMRVLLISSSNVHGTGYLDHAEPEIRDFLGPVRRVLFFPWALKDWGGYGAKVRERLGRMGLRCGLDPRGAGSGARRGRRGGRVRRRRQHVPAPEDDVRGDVLVPLRRRVGEGMPYVGSSAGSNVAGETIRSTNDMPVVEPPSLSALGIVPFCLNPHYLDPDPASTHMGETREERIAQFLEENEQAVVGLREGAILRIEGRSASLRGIARMRLFRRGQPPEEFEPGARLDFLLGQK